MVVRSFLTPVIVVVLGGLCGFFLFKGKQPVSQEPVPEESSPLAGLSAIALGENGRLYLGGDFGVRVMDSTGEEISHWKTSEKVSSLAVDSTGQIYVASYRKVEKLAPDGTSLLVWGRGGCSGDDFTLVTGLAVDGKDVFVADAGVGVVYHFTGDGEPLNEIDGNETAGEKSGFLIPSPYFDCSVKDGVVYVNNPGHFRIEKYDFEGNRLGQWGRGGMKKEQFPGCCNPTNLAVFSDGRVVTSQKGGACIKVFDAQGSFLQQFGEDIFGDDARGIDLAVDARGRIFAVDPGAHCVRVFE